jgi:fructose-bisphosphate aldolase class II
VKLTGLDALAIAIGTSHGAYKFSSKPTGETLKMQRLIEIHRRLPNVHLVMHGSSSVPQDLQDIVNQYGGKLKPTWGVPVEEIQLGIRNGVRKINVDTDNRLAITGAIRKVLMEKPEEFDPRSYMKPAREAMKKVVALRMTQFGQAGHAGDYQPIPLAKMAERYASDAVAV